MAGDKEESDLFGVRFKGDRLSEFREFKESKGATSGSDALRRAVDLAFEVENEGRPRELKREVEQLQERLDEKDERIEEFRARIGKLEQENERLGKTPPLIAFRNAAAALFIIGILGFIGMVSQTTYPEPGSLLGYLSQIFLSMAAFGMVGLTAYPFISIFKILLPQAYGRAARQVFSLPFVGYVFDLETWYPEDEKADQHHPAGGE